MRNPDKVLNSLQEHAASSHYSYERLYRIMYNREMYLRAYKKIAPKAENMIHSTDGKMRPLGIPSIDDKLVQEVCRMILESIYEPGFEETSHGFRAGRSCHTALFKIKHNFNGCRWFVEGDIEGFFNNIDHDVLIGILRKRIKDKRFLNLIRKFLNAGYMEDWKFQNTFSGTP